MNRQSLIVKFAAAVLLTAALVPAVGTLGASHASADILLPAVPPACSADPTYPCITIQQPSSPGSPIVVSGAYGSTSATTISQTPQLELDVKDGDTTVYSSQSPQITAQSFIHNEHAPSRAVQFEFTVDQRAIPGPTRNLTFSVTATALSGSTDSHGLLLPFYTHHTSNVYTVDWISRTPRISVLCKWSTSFVSPVPNDDGWLVSANALPGSVRVELRLVDVGSRVVLWDDWTDTLPNGKFDVQDGDDWYNIHIPADRFTNRDTARLAVVALIPSTGDRYDVSARGYFDVCSSPS